MHAFKKEGAQPSPTDPSDAAYALSMTKLQGVQDGSKVWLVAERQQLSQTSWPAESTVSFTPSLKVHSITAALEINPISALTSDFFSQAA
eukprot:1154305-Pelagomonas_calceolata.AAC.6